MRSKHLCRVDREWYTGRFRVHIGLYEPGGEAFRMLAAQVTGDPIPEFGVSRRTSTPLVTLDRPAAQDLFDELWLAGLRPKQDQSDGERAAMKAHIADLRMVVERTLATHESPTAPP